MSPIADPGYNALKARLKARARASNAEPFLTTTDAATFAVTTMASLQIVSTADRSFGTASRTG
jgi:hypothetical protein